MQVFNALNYHGQANPSAIFSEDDSHSITYGDALRRINKIANQLIIEGLRAGDRIAIISRNCSNTLLLIYAAAKIGVVNVPINTRLTKDDWLWLIKDSMSQIVFGEKEMLSTLPKTCDTNFQYKSIPFDHNFERWFENASENLPETQTDMEAPFLQVYTSGTTGKPKGVVLTNKNSYAQTTAFAAAVRQSIKSGDICLQNLPLFHIGGIFVALYAIFLGGGVLLRRDFNPVEQIDILERPDVVCAAMVPTMINACLIAGTDRDLNFETLEFIIYGASPISKATLRDAIHFFECDFVQVFGMTESHSMITILDAQSHQRGLSGEKPALLESCGRAAPGTEVRILNESGDEQSTGDWGEIVCRGDQIMKAYWKRPDATAQTIIDGWLHTGDAGVKDEEGYIYIVDRLKDIIISGGENIAPREIEDILVAHPKITESAVIGIPHEKWGETVAAFVSLVDGTSLEVEEIVTYCKSTLASFKVPRHVEILPSLPKNGSGKILRRTLREPFWEDTKRSVS